MPTRDTPWPAGTPCWIDYGAADVQAATAFYGELFGWSCTGGDEEFGGYLNATRDGAQVAGLGPLMGEDDAPSWTTYFATDDAAATVARIREAGGTVVVEPMEIGPLGTMVVAQDPQGFPFGLWQSGEHTGVQRFNEPGSLVWNEAAVTDPDAAREFYTAVFGFAWDPMEGMEPYATFRTDDRPLGGLSRIEPGLPTGWTVCFAVASTDEVVARVGRRAERRCTPPRTPSSAGSPCSRTPGGLRSR
ncbi:VOC family protein [Candidatus Blastococcus massiliensis]|uniref:VOC family protein n=1 Tax=Candidatus Blastococcus massiliensis TaxID=1470358 RepID=UPI0004B17408|nr:VOC family protein [Candidatus Blastococcus massiliensis]